MRDPVQFFGGADWSLGVVGLGYVGLPLAVTASERGLRVIGLDHSADVVEQLTNGASHVDDVADVHIAESLARGARFTEDSTELSDVDAVFICVPSPLGRNREPDLTYIEEAVTTLGKVARPGQLVVLESTTYPGTTDELVVPAVEKAGLTIDDDVWVAYSPERVSPGDRLKTADIPKVVGGVTRTSGQVAAAAYGRIVPAVHIVSSARVAEMSKLLENTYRAVNIGLVNEIAQLSHELDIDIWEVIDAAATKPFGFQPFYPGPGVGGHCIPLDPQYLAWKARGANFATRFIETAEQINSRMPEYVVTRIGDMLNMSGRAVRESRILVVGLAYKPNVSDDRESASLQVARLLHDCGGEIRVIDPHVGAERIAHHGFRTAPELLGACEYDLAVVLTDHAEMDYSLIAASASSVFDTRGVYRRLGLALDNVEVL